jgi:hypothetical protein
MRMYLELWGLHEVVSDAQLCVSELVANVITHVGVGTPATLAVSLRGNRLRIEVHDPNTRALPSLVSAEDAAEAGRGLALVDAVAASWGVQLHAGKKATWCELATGLPSVDGHPGRGRVNRADALVSLYRQDWAQLARPARAGALGVSLAGEVAIDIITDLLHWLSVHGCDADTALDLAQTHFEAEICEAEGSSK